VTSHLGLEHLDFGFVSDFDIRYSDLVAANGRAKVGAANSAYAPMMVFDTRQTSQRTDSVMMPFSEKKPDFFC